MNLLNLFESNDSGFQALDAWKQQVLQAYPEHAGKIKFLGRDDQVSAEVPGMDRSFGVFDLDTEQGQVLDEAHNKYHANRTGFTKPQRDLSGEGEPEGMFAVVIDGRPWKEFTSNKAFAVAKTIAAKYPNKTVQVKWPTGQLNTVKEEWSQKYKSSINCSHPRGFSQKAHCAGKKKHNESTEMEMVCEDCGMCETHGNHMMEVKQRLDAKCWTGKKIGNPKTKIKGGIRVNNCVPAESVAEGVAETIPWKEAQTVLNHYGADYFGTSYDKLYFYKYRKQFSIGLIRDEDGNGNHSVNLSELNAMVRKLRSMRVPLNPFEEGASEGSLNEFVTPQATAQDPGLEREKDVDVIIFGRMPQDFTYNSLIQALEAVLPREYPPGSSQNTQGVPSSPAERIGGEIAKHGGAVVTTKPLSIAQKLVKEFQARGIKCKIDAPGLEEGGDDPWGDQGNFAGDKPVNIGGETVKPIQVGDTVTYLGQKAKILAQSKDRKHSRITIAKGIGSVTQDVLTSDLKRTGLNEFAPPGGDDREPDEEAILRQLAAQWWNGTEQQMARAQKTLAAMGWEIGQDESGDDDAGVFLIRAGDEHGDSYIAFNHSDLELNESKDVVHRIGLTVTDPNHPMVSKRGETIQKTVRVTGGNQEQAINRAIAHHRKKGYKVHDHHYIGTANSPAVKEEGPGPGAETGFGAEGSKKLGTVNTELISRAWKENRPNVVLTFGKSGEYRLDRGMIRYLLGYYKALPDDNSKWYFIYETMSRLEKLVALLEKANLPNSGIPTPGQQELDLTEKKRPKDDLSSAGARDADVQRALQKARAATPTASSDIGALVKQDLQTQEKTQQKLADIEADNQRQMDMLKKADSVNNDQQRAIRSLERQISKVPGATAPAKIEPTPAPKKSAVTPVAPAVEPARMPPMARPRPNIGNKVPADVSIPSISTPSISLPDPTTAVQSPSTAVQSPSTAVQSPTMLQIPQGQQTILPAMTPQPASQYNTADAVDVDFRHLGAAPNLDNFDEPEEPQKRTGTYGEGIQETANDMIKFSIDGERAYDAVMDRFGHVIDWSDDSMTAPRKFWLRIEELAHDFGGEASEEGSEFALSDSAGNN